jgi:hypothetical protein
MTDKKMPPYFKGVKFDAFTHEAGANAFTLSTQRWTGRIEVRRG